MPPKGHDLQTPWIRTQLIDWLDKLGNRDWQEENWLRQPSGGSGLDEALDFFDDSGVLAEPSGRLGFVLFDDVEVSAMTVLNSALDSALSSASNDAEIIHSQAWGEVVAAAREALNIMGDSRKES
ncbi:SCO4402 family protein [Streptomyces sp. NBC_00335]|uniref:SCO4402 family protein n=1 Tax=Streptomyces sp. NBC_00335 TaxID=2975714 RepID=UPI003FA78519